MKHQEEVVGLAARHDKIVYAANITYVLAFTFPRLSIVGLYYRIFSSPRLRLATHAAMAFIVLNGLSYFILAFFTCSVVKTSYCVKDSVFRGAVNPPVVVSDLCLLILPLPSILTMRLPKRKRAGIVITFGIGCM